MICRAVLPSETYAYKAHRVLTANGYPCEIVRSSGLREGCGFSLRMTGNCEQAHALLIREGIPVQSVRIERDGI